MFVNYQKPNGWFWEAAKTTGLPSSPLSGHRKQHGCREEQAYQQGQKGRQEEGAGPLRAEGLVRHQGAEHVHHAELRQDDHHADGGQQYVGRNLTFLAGGGCLVLVSISMSVPWC